MNDRELLNLAYEVSKNAYAPYSKFPVGAALECADGKVYTGCNVENASMGATICAERTAITKAVSEGQLSFVRLAIYADSEDYCVPCGVCRQFISEFSDDIEILCARSGGRYVSYKIGQLLAHPFKLKTT